MTGGTATWRPAHAHTHLAGRSQPPIRLRDGLLRGGHARVQILVRLLQLADLPLRRLCLVGRRAAVVLRLSDGHLQRLDLALLEPQRVLQRAGGAVRLLRVSGRRLQLPSQVGDGALRCLDAFPRAAELRLEVGDDGARLALRLRGALAGVTECLPHGDLGGRASSDGLLKLPLQRVVLLLQTVELHGRCLGGKGSAGGV